MPRRPEVVGYPPTTGCSWGGDPEAVWTAMEGRGAVYTYAEVHQAIQPAFQAHCHT